MKQYYIKERVNPQFDKPYYVPCGQLTKREAKRHEKVSYGSNTMFAFATEDEYKAALAKLKDGGGDIIL